jgi:oligosaccharide repeat unit polymerase
MLILIIFALTLLTVNNYILGGKSLFHPAVAFCGMWTIALVCVLISGDTYYPVSDETLMIFFYGSLSLSLGATCGNCILVSQNSRAYRAPQKLLTWGVVAVLLLFPFYIIWLLRMVAEHPADFFLQSARASFVALLAMGPEKYTPTYILFINLLAVVPLVALTAWAERKTLKKRTALAIIVAFFYLVPTGARSALVQLMMSLICLDWLMARRLRWKLFSVVSAITLTFFLSIALILHVGNKDLSLMDNVRSGFTEFTDYIAGPVVAFDRVVRDPNLVTPHTPSAASFFLETAIKLGIKVDLPVRNTRLIDTGPDHNQNVYSIYFSYLDVGWPLACVFLFIQGLVLSAIYKLALSGSRQWMILYSVLFACVVATTFGDFLVSNLNFLLKTFAFCWLCYSFPVILSKASAAGRGIVTESIRPANTPG